VGMSMVGQRQVQDESRKTTERIVLQDDPGVDHEQ